MPIDPITFKGPEGGDPKEPAPIEVTSFGWGAENPNNSVSGVDGDAAETSPKTEAK
jgi:hypothetical protein